MNKFIAIFMLLFFVATLPVMSMFMLSIENGVVYTENYDLNHIITKSSITSPSKCKLKALKGFHSPAPVNHTHVILTNFFIPENIPNEANSQFSSTGLPAKTLSPIHFSIPLLSPSLLLLNKQRYKPLVTFPILLKTNVLLT